MVSDSVKTASDSMDTETQCLLSIETYSHQEAVLLFLICVLVQHISWVHLFWFASYQAHPELGV